ncbi:MAG TPA: OmpA family protein [Candidatus Hydrogenedentes bacterium]|nr:OmpA family protein [Candidatus Hydrogenedentota bacterium]
MSYLRNGLLIALCVAVTLTVSSGCSRNKKPIEPIQPALDSGAGAGSETTTGTGLPGVDQEGLSFVSAGVKPIYFDYNSYALRPDALATLKANAEVFTTQLAGSYIQIEGHCDDRGTQEYNLALGEKRALAARDYLIKLGVGGDRIITISYGEEVPADPGQNESAWALNRRCEFNRANR